MELAVMKHRGKPLKPHDREWIEAYFQTGSASEASRRLGVEKNVKQHAYNMKQKLSVCIQQNLTKFIGHCAPDALEIVFDLAKNCEDPKVRLAAAVDILNRAGYKESRKVEVSIEDKSSSELDTEIKRLLSKGGIIDAAVIGE